MKVLWKHDRVLGIAYYCPKCKTFVCGEKTCRYCGQELEYKNLIQEEYKGKVYWR